jgi:Mu transposase-like protein
MVSVSGNLYSVPDTARRRILDIHVLADEIRIFANITLVAVHAPLEGRDKTTVDPAHRQASTLSRRRRGADRPMSSAALATGLPAARSIFTRPSAVASLATETRNYRPCRDRSLRGRAHQANLGPQDAARYRDPRRDGAPPRAGEVTALEAIDALLAEEFTLRENPRQDHGTAPHHQDARRLRRLLPALARQEPHHGTLSSSSSIAPRSCISSARPN